MYNFLKLLRLKLSARAPLKKTSLIGFLQIINEAVRKIAIFIPTSAVLLRKLSMLFKFQVQRVIERFFS